MRENGSTSKNKVALTSAAGDGLRRDNRNVINGIL
jgi:hypothetical protein